MTTLSETGVGMVHHVAAGLCAAMAIYNLLRFCQTRTVQHGVNTALYAAGWAWEVARARDHEGQ